MRDSNNQWQPAPSAPSAENQAPDRPAGENPFTPPKANVDDPVQSRTGKTGADPSGQPAGIGGWLILPAISLVFTPFRMGFQFVRDFTPVLTNNTWNVLTDPASPAYHPLWMPFLIFEIGANLALFSLTLWLAWLFFHKSVKVPRLFIIWLLAQAALHITDQLFGSLIPAVASQPDAEGSREVVRALIAMAIWIPYFLKSKRVRNTFVVPASSKS